MAINSDTVAANDFVNACRLLSNAGNTDGDAGEIHPNAILCHAYLHGFFSATDKVVIDEDRPSAFTLRALRTRGRRLSDQQEDLLNSDYCIPQKDTVLDVADKIATLEPAFADNADANTVVEIVLQRHYRCDED